MRVTTERSEPEMRLRLRQCGNHGVALVAEYEGEEQDIMVFDSRADPIRDQKDGPTLFARTVKFRPGFPVDRDEHGHMVIRKKA